MADLMEKFELKKEVAQSVDKVHLVVDCLKTNIQGTVCCWNTALMGKTVFQ